MDFLHKFFSLLSESRIRYFFFQCRDKILPRFRSILRRDQTHVSSAEQISDTSAVTMTRRSEHTKLSERIAAYWERTIMSTKRIHDLLTDGGGKIRLMLGAFRGFPGRLLSGEKIPVPMSKIHLGHKTLKRILPEITRIFTLIKTGILLGRAKALHHSRDRPVMRSLARAREKAGTHIADRFRYAINFATEIVVVIGVKAAEALKIYVQKARARLRSVQGKFLKTVEYFNTLYSSVKAKIGIATRAVPQYLNVRIKTWAGLRKGVTNAAHPEPFRAKMRFTGRAAYAIVAICKNSVRRIKRFYTRLRSANAVGTAGKINYLRLGMDEKITTAETLRGASFLKKLRLIIGGFIRTARSKIFQSKLPKLRLIIGGFIRTARSQIFQSKLPKLRLIIGGFIRTARSQIFQSKLPKLRLIIGGFIRRGSTAASKSLTGRFKRSVLIIRNVVAHRLHVFSLHLKELKVQLRVSRSQLYAGVTGRMQRMQTALRQTDMIGVYRSRFSRLLFSLTGAARVSASQYFCGWLERLREFQATLRKKAERQPVSLKLSIGDMFRKMAVRTSTSLYFAGLFGRIREFKAMLRKSAERHPVSVKISLGELFRLTKLREIGTRLRSKSLDFPLIAEAMFGTIYLSGAGVKTKQKQSRLRSTSHLSVWFFPVERENDLYILQAHSVTETGNNLTIY